MRLSISSFSQTSKIIPIFLVFFTSYNIYLTVAKPDVHTFQNQWQKNMSFAQDFIYDNKAKNIIVGSSMAARMGNEFFPDDYFNLSFSGGSVLTGLEIIKQSAFIPSKIYIENNIIFRKKDHVMMETLFYPYWWKVKSYVPAFKEKYQPLNIVISNMNQILGKTHEEHMSQKRNEIIYSSQMKEKAELYSMELSNYDFELTELKNLVKHFEQQGVKIYFFEMPIASKLANLKRAKEQRKIIHENFGNEWLDSPDNKQYITTDGVHLMYKSVLKYTRYFLSEADKTTSPDPNGSIKHDR